MAGTIIADYIRSDANKLSLNVGNTTIASVNATGLLNSSGGVILYSNGQFGTGATLPTSSLTGTIANTQISTTANTIPRASMTSGAILQVVHASYDPGTTTTTSTTLVDTGLTVNITPTSTSSRFFVLVSLHECFVDASARAIGTAIVRNGTVISDTQGATLGYVSSGGANYFNVNMHMVDSPATTSTLTYKAQFRSIYGSSVSVNGDGSSTYITVMEIA